MRENRQLKKAKMPPAGQSLKRFFSILQLWKSIGNAS